MELHAHAQICVFEIYELHSRFSSLSKAASKVLHVVPIILLDCEEHDFNDLIVMYESDLMDKCLVDQEVMLWKRKWAQCSPEECPDSLGVALVRTMQ